MNKIILIIIIFLASAIRLWQIDRIPPGLTWDEAAIGYNAYSILKTGQDEHGNFLPIIFKSFADYKPGLYIYLTVPTIAIFGLNEFSVRLPSVIFGLLCIIAIYLLANELFPKNNLNLKFIKLNLGHLTAFSLAVNPWHLHFSRGAWETNVFVTLISFSLLFLLKSFKKPKLLTLSLILAGLTLITYQAAKLLTPLVFLLSLIIFFSDFKKSLTIWLSQKINLFGIIITLAITGYVIFGVFFGKTGNRLATQNILSYKPEPSALLQNIDNHNKTILSLFHNQTELSTRLIFNRFFNHLSPDLLFYQGERVSDRGHIPNLGMFYLFDALLLVLGIYFLAEHPNNKSKSLVIGSLIIAILPGSLTLEEFSTVRSLFFVIPANILVSCGLYYVVKKLKIFSLLLLPIYLLNIFYGLDLYFNHSRPGLSSEFNYGYKQAIEYIKSHPSDKVVMTDVYGQPYIYYLFYTQFDPATYQKLKPFVDQGLDVGKVDKFINLEFHQFGLNDIKNSKNTTFIGTQGNIPNSFDFSLPEIDDYTYINAFDGKPFFRIIKTKK